MSPIFYKGHARRCPPLSCRTSPPHGGEIGRPLCRSYPAAVKVGISIHDSRSPPSGRDVRQDRGREGRHPLQGGPTPRHSLARPPHTDGEVLGARGLVGGQHQPHASGVDGHGFLRADVFAGRHGRGEMCRAIGRRRGQNHQVHVGGEHLLICVKPGEAPLVGDLDPRSQLGVGCQLGQLCPALGQAVRREIAKGDQFHALRAAEAVVHRASATASASNQPETDDIRPLGPRTAGPRQGGRRSCGADERAT